MIDIPFATASQLAAAIQAGSVSSTEVVEGYLAQIAEHNPALNAIITLDAEGARERARAADMALARGENWGALHGVPFTLKDAHATAGMRTTVGFPMLDHVPQTDGTVAARLKAAGGILLGKTNVALMLGDFQSDNPIFGRTNNPWQLAHTPGGSSGGAAAALAAGMTPFDIGTDLSGSLRIPAHFCGLFGLKPTEKRVSLAGVIPGLPTPRSVRIMSCIGPMARSVADLTLLYSLIAGPDGYDTEVQPVPIEPVPTVALTSLRIAVAPTFPGVPVAAAIGQAVTDVAQQLSQLGAIVAEVPLPTIDFRQELGRAGDLMGMMIGAFQPQADAAPPTLDQYLAALDQRDQVMLAWERFFDEWDVLLCPPAMTTAFAHCAPGTPLPVDGEEQFYWAISGHTTLFNYTGHPAIVLPYTQDQTGLPLGLQLVGKRWSESRLLAIAQSLTQVTGDFQRPPGY